jgi:thioredoxin-like negative regulator of GroEL
MQNFIDFVNFDYDDCINNNYIAEEKKAYNNSCNNNSINKKRKKREKSENKYKLCLFYADWCHYSKNFFPVWDKICEKLYGKIVCAKYNHETDEIKIHNIQGFPTIMLMIGEKKYEYTDMRNEESIIKFIEQKINMDYN